MLQFGAGAGKGLHRLPADSFAYPSGYAALERRLRFSCGKFKCIAVMTG